MNTEETLELLQKLTQPFRLLKSNQIVFSGLASNINTTFIVLGHGGAENRELVCFGFVQPEKAFSIYLLKEWYDRDHNFFLIEMNESCNRYLFNRSMD